MTDLTRRGVLSAGTGLVAGSALAASATAPLVETVPLWPARPPGSMGAAITRTVAEQSHDPTRTDRWISGIAVPELAVCRPARPNGSAVLLLPGGGYGFLAYDNEGTSQAQWLNALGVTAFILTYRLPAEGWANRAEVPLQDAQRAMRLIRHGATRFGIDPAKIAVIGFSAGGHLAGSLATRHGEKVYEPVDSADSLSARPELAGLIYPVVSLAAPFTHVGSRDNLLGPGFAPADAERRSVERRIDEATPPLFLVHAADDGLVPVENSLALFAATQKAKRPAEMHIFDEAGHGFGVRLPPTVPPARWPELFTTYARRKGVFA